MQNDNEARLQEQLGLALEALEVLADGDGEPTDIARQTLDDITRVGMEAVALQEMDANTRSRPDTSAGAEEVERVAAALRDFDLKAQHEGILTEAERSSFYERAAHVAIAALSPTAEQRADTAALAEDVITDICNGAVMLANESDTGDRVWQAAYHAVTATKVALRASPDGQTVALLREAREAAEQARDILESYIGFLHRVPADELEMHPYIPSVEEAFDRASAVHSSIDAALSTGAEQ